MIRDLLSGRVKSLRTTRVSRPAVALACMLCAAQAAAQPTSKPSDAARPVPPATSAPASAPAKLAPQPEAGKAESVGATASAPVPAKTEAKESEAAPADAAKPEPAKPAADEATAPATQAPAAETPAANPAPPADSASTQPMAPLSALINLHLFVMNVWNKDPGYDLFSRDDVGQRVGLTAEVDLLHLTTDTILSVEAGVGGEAESNGNTPAALAGNSTLGATHVLAGVGLRHAVLSWLALQLRAHGGLSFTELKLTSNGSDKDLTSETKNPYGALGAGLLFQTEPRRLDPQRTSFNSVAFGVRCEGGYLMSPSIALAFPSQSVDLPEQRVRSIGAPLGSLDRSGPYLEVSGFLRF